mgnify:CR=1 FL=1
MKLFFGWIVLFVFILFSFYYVNLNLEKSVDINELINISNTESSITYSAKDTNNENNIIEFSLEKQNEIFVINGNRSENNSKGKKEITIEIERENRDIVLILNSKEQTIWNIVPSENTNIKLVVYDTKSSVVSKRSIYKYKKDIDLDISLENIKFIKLLEYVNKITQKDKIDYFYSKEILENKIEIKDILSNPKLSLKYLLAKKIENNFEFELISKDNKFIPFSLNGPRFNEEKFTEIKTNVVSSPDKTKIYEIVTNGLKITNILTKKEILKPIPVLKKIINPKGIAYDDLSDMIYIANKDGKFYIFDAQTESWKSIRKYIDDFYINSLSYDTLTNTFLSSNWKKNGLIIFDQQGNFDSEYSLENKLLGFNYHFKKSSLELPQLFLVPNGENIGIVLIDKFVQKIWLFNKFDRKAILTYNYRN